MRREDGLIGMNSWAKGFPKGHWEGIDQTALLATSKSQPHKYIACVRQNWSMRGEQGVLQPVRIVDS